MPVDYSKFDNIVDSDDEVDVKPKPSGPQVSAMREALMMGEQLMVAEELVSCGRYEEALPRLRLYHQKCPADPDAVTLLVATLYNLGAAATGAICADYAREIIDVSDDGPLRGYGYCLMGHTLCTHYAHYRLAAAQLELGIRHLEPWQDKDMAKSIVVTSRVHLGQCYADMGDTERATAEFKVALQHSPSNRDVVCRWADLLYHDVGEVKQALQLYDAVLAEDRRKDGAPGDVSGYDWAALHAGAFASAMGDHSAARRYHSLIPMFDFEAMDLDGFEEHMSSLQRRLPATQIEIFKMIVAARAGDHQTAEMFQQGLAESEGRSTDFRATTWSFIASKRVGATYDASLFYGNRQMLHLGMDAAALCNGLVLEFGVGHGHSIRMIAQHLCDAPVHGFDSFMGLPEQWNGEPIGAYSVQGVPPSNLPSNVHLHLGLFKDTLPSFLGAHPGPVRFMNVDCDLYSSTKDVLDQVSCRIVKGTVILFDEYVQYESWQEGEFKAFQEAASANRWTFEYLGISILSKQAVIRITGVGQA